MVGGEKRALAVGGVISVTVCWRRKCREFSIFVFSNVSNYSYHPSAVDGDSDVLFGHIFADNRKVGKVLSKRLLPPVVLRYRQ